MADVQLENGYTRIANELLDALTMYDFSGLERKFIDAIIRLSYGCGKKTATFPSWSACESFGLSRQCLLSTRRKDGILDKLAKANIIQVDYDTKTVGIQKYYGKWNIKPKQIVNTKKFKALIDYNLKCKLQLTNVSSSLQGKKGWCKPQLTDLSATAYKDVSYSLQELLVEAHKIRASRPPKERKERKDNIYIYNKQGICHSSDLLSRLEFLPGIIDISRSQDKAYFDYISKFPDDKIGVVLAEAQRRTGLDSKDGERLTRKSVLKFIAGGLENYDKLYKHRKLSPEQKLADAQRVYELILNDKTADKSDPTYIAALEQAEAEVERLGGI